ncbi:hypothetical protein Bbelb_436540 [Branchiostoma belcheri]|nr:hypothetical protein Bbelb_436540 [Branchiostoma belcheri]
MGKAKSHQCPAEDEEITCRIGTAGRRRRQRVRQNRTSPSPTTPIYISESYQVIPRSSRQGEMGNHPRHIGRSDGPRFDGDGEAEAQLMRVFNNKRPRGTGDISSAHGAIQSGALLVLSHYTTRARSPGGRVDKEMIIRAFFNRDSRGASHNCSALPDLRTRSDISSHQCASGSRYKGTLLPLELHSPRQGNVQEYVMRSHRGRKTEIIKMNIIGAYFLLQPSRYYSTERPLSLLPSLRRFCAVIKTGGAGPGNRVREAAASPVFSGRENCECSAAGRRYGTQPSVTQEVLRGLHVASCGTEVSKQPSRDNANIAVGKER